MKRRSGRASGHLVYLYASSPPGSSGCPPNNRTVRIPEPCKIESFLYMPPYLTRIEGPPPKRNVVSSSLAGGAKRTAVSRFYGLQRFLLSYLLSGAAAPSVYFLLQQDISQGLERSDLADTGVCFWVFQNDPGTGVEKQQHEHRAAVLLLQHLHESRGAHVWLVSRGCRCGLH